MLRKLQFDCGAELKNWETQWSVEKQQWCCKHEDRGCKSTSLDHDEFNCTHDYHNWTSKWTKQKKAWCCVQDEPGCKLALSKPFDCNGGGFPTFYSRWSAAKKAWCCKNEQLGCANQVLVISKKFEQIRMKAPNVSSMLGLNWVFFAVASGLGAISIMARCRQRSWPRCTQTIRGAGLEDELYESLDVEDVVKNRDMHQ